jgi:creatinine amidohydrolase
MSEVLLRKHTRREFRQRMESGELKACVIPIAAIEQHLEHLAMEHDWRSAQHVATLLAEQLKPNVLVVEGVMAGISEHHMKHMGTVTISPGAFIAVLNDIVDSMVRAGFKNILVLNGHGGNIVPLKGVWDQFVRRHQVNLQFMSYWDAYTAKDAEDILDSGKRLPDDLPGHAQEFETSFALEVFPENVRTDMWTDQEDPNPAMATAGKGREFIDRLMPRLVEKLGNMIAGDDVVAMPHFH